MGINYKNHYWGFCEKYCSNCGKTLKEVWDKELKCRKLIDNLEDINREGKD